MAQSALNSIRSALGAMRVRLMLVAAAINAKHETPPWVNNDWMAGWLDLWIIGIHKSINP